VLFSFNFFNLGANCFLSHFLRKDSWSTGIFLWEIGTFRLLARRLLIPGFTVLWIASFFTKYNHHRNHCSHLTGLCGFDCNVIIPRVIRPCPQAKFVSPQNIKTYLSCLKKGTFEGLAGVALSRG
jgi:hypothetical protein